MNFLIFGGSYSGSTVLSGMLGAHSRISTLGELAQWYLRRVLAENREGKPDDLLRLVDRYRNMDPQLSCCRLCGPSCKVWSSAPGTGDPIGLYEKLRAHVHADHIVDSSKDPAWYEMMISRCRSDDYRIVLLHKPVWGMLASIARYGGLPSSSAMTDEAFRTAHGWWCMFYRRFREIIGRYGLEESVVNVRYKDLSRHPKDTLRKIIDPLPFEMGMEFGFNLPHHEIAGNSKLKLLVAARARHVPLLFDQEGLAVAEDVRRRCIDMDDCRELMLWLGREDDLK